MPDERVKERWEDNLLLGAKDTQRRLNPKLGNCPGSKVIFE